MTARFIDISDGVAYDMTMGIGVTGVPKYFVLFLEIGVAEKRYIVYSST